MNISRLYKRLFILLTVTLITVSTVYAQSGSNEFTLGNQLLRNGEFEEAYEIFRKLMEENPRSYAAYDRAVTALINLKRYDEAIRITRERLGRSGTDVNTIVKLGEIYHIADRPEDAFRTWNQIIDRYSDNLHAYRRIAETMNQRRLYREAILVYEQAREKLGDPGLFTFEIANNHLAVRSFEEALNEYLKMLSQDERRLSQIKRQLVNYDERQLYDTAIIVTQEWIERESPGSTLDLRLRDFLVWLNMERGLYRRALAAAKTLERYSGNQQHVLFQTGQQLRTQQEFELAEEAFRYYVDLETHPLQAHSYEELSRSYQDWATWLVDHNLDFGGAADSLYRKAFDTVEQLTARFPRYERIMNILTIQSELALDHLKQPDLATEYHNRMQQSRRSDTDEALAHYIEGRILLFQGEFSMARVAFTRSNRIAGSGDIAERSRYYLGLGDFYNSDFTYARMQLRALERQNTSFFANNALRLRYIIQEAYDEEGDNEPLRRYAHARYLYDTGQYTRASGLLASVLDEPGHVPLHSESTLLLARSLRRIHPELALSVIERHTLRPSIQQNPGEQLLWERARLAELVHMMHQRSGDSDSGSSAPQNNIGNGNEYPEYEPGSREGMSLIIPPELLTGSGSGIFNRFYQSGNNRTAVPGETVVVYYEELLMHYPDGFYAGLARDRIRVIEKDPREL